jgi:hypothetical protein
MVFRSRGFGPGASGEDVGLNGKLLSWITSAGGTISGWFRGMLQRRVKLLDRKSFLLPRSRLRASIGERHFRQMPPKAEMVSFSGGQLNLPHVIVQDRLEAAIIPFYSDA